MEIELINRSQATAKDELFIAHFLKTDKGLERT